MINQLLDRRHDEAKRALNDEMDYRESGQKDRDRILFCSAFRRLAGVTQVASTQEGHSFHNRLTHSLKVAQIARALASKLLKTDQSGLLKRFPINPDIAEAAALAHDLGHPPFGHVAETKLHHLAQDVGLEDGFEGNAQTFRIVTKLAIRKEQFSGLNLTRGSLNALLKYPWMYGSQGKRSTRKWNAYFSEREDFEFARAGQSQPYKCIEAEIMDWADDIAYSIHDVEDFYRANLIPLDRLVSSLQSAGELDAIIPGSEIERFLNATFARWTQKGIQSEYSTQEKREPLIHAFINIIAQLKSIRTPYDGSHAQKAYLRNFTSRYVSRYINAVSLCDPEDNAGHIIQIRQDALYEVKMLKELTWHYVMRSPALTAQKHGQQHMIETLFRTFHSAALASQPQDWDIFPFGYRERLEATDEALERSRIVVDFIAGMTETQAIQMYQRLTGSAQSSMLLPIVL